MSDQNNRFFRERTLNLGGHCWVFDRPVVMAILNATPDSFFLPDERRIAGKPQAAVDLAGQLLDAGADWLDIGGMSTRPGAELVTPSAEADRVLPVLEAIHAAFPEAILSIDTVHEAVARSAVAAGATLVNDVSAGSLDENLLPAVAELRVPYVLMHMQGVPATMQDKPQYEDPNLAVFDFLEKRIAACRALGIGDIIVDPGFGFGKTMADNYRLLAGLDQLSYLGCPIMVGVSRKSMVCKALGVNPPAALNGSTVLHTLALAGGADILRVHDPREAQEAITLFAHYAAVQASLLEADPEAKPFTPSPHSS